MIVLRDIRLESHCEHHIVPILAKAHIGYLPAGRVAGISKLARLVEVFAKRMRIQVDLLGSCSRSHGNSLIRRTSTVTRLIRRGFELGRPYAPIPGKGAVATATCTAGLPPRPRGSDAVHP